MEAVLSTLEEKHFCYFPGQPNGPQLERCWGQIPAHVFEVNCLVKYHLHVLHWSPMQPTPEGETMLLDVDPQERVSVVSSTAPSQQPTRSLEELGPWAVTKPMFFKPTGRLRPREES